MHYRQNLIKDIKILFDILFWYFSDINYIRDIWRYSILVCTCPAGWSWYRTSCTSRIILLYNMQHVENPIWTLARNFPSRSSNTRLSLGTNAITICWYLSRSVQKFVESNELFRESSPRWRTSFSPSSFLIFYRWFYLWFDICYI